MNSVNMIAKILLIIGGLNWGLAIWDINLVTAVSAGIFADIVYALVGLSALWAIYKLVKK